MSSSSSTTRIVSDILASLRSRAGVSPVACVQRQLRDLPAHRKLQDDATAAREVVPHANEAVVIGDDRRDDCEPEAGALRLGGEVRLEQARLHLGAHARAVVGDLEPYDAELR